MSCTIEIELGAGSGPGEFISRVVSAPSGGQPSVAAHLDVDALLQKRPALETAVLASAVAGRKIAPAHEQQLREVGQQLFEALFSGPVLGTYRASVGHANERGEPLRVVLRLTDPQLAALPWEALFDPETQRYLCQDKPLVRQVSAPYTPRPVDITPPLRVLGLVASPGGLDALDVAAERALLEQALAAPMAEGLIEVQWLEQASWAAVQEKLLSDQWHVLHFIGHGDYDVANDQGTIALVGDDGRANMVEAEQLAALLDQAHPPLRLAVLNSCSSGEQGTQDLFSGTAAALVRSGISAAAAMQFTISDGGALSFARGFYTAISHGRSVDDAVESGRISMLGARRSLEWVTPVLYVRGENADLFTFPPAEPTEPVELTPPAGFAQTAVEPAMAPPPATAAAGPRPVAAAHLHGFSVQAAPATHTPSATSAGPLLVAALGHPGRRRRVIAALATVLTLLALLVVGLWLYTGQPSPNYPRTVTHSFGATLITAEPTAVAALGPGDADVVLSLGVQPVAVLAAGGELPGYLQTRVNGNVKTLTALNDTAIAIAHPDLIIDTGTLDQSQYNALSAITATVARPEGVAWTWQDQLSWIADLLDRPDTATELLTAAADRQHQLRTTHPAFDGKTVLAVTVTDSGVTAAPADSRAAAYLEGLGMRYSDTVPAAPAGQSAVPVDPAALNTSPTDVRLVIRTDRNAGEGNYNGLPAPFTRYHGATVILDDPDLITALNTGGPAAVEFLDTKLVDAISAMVH